MKETKEKPASLPDQVQPVVRHSPFGDWFDIGTKSDVVILATNNGGGLVPRRLCLPHQVYVHRVRELEREHLARVTAIPASSSDYVDLPNKGLSDTACEHNAGDDT